MPVRWNRDVTVGEFLSFRNTKVNTTGNVTLSCFRVIIVTVEKQQILHILSANL